MLVGCLISDRDGLPGWGKGQAAGGDRLCGGRGLGDGTGVRVGEDEAGSVLAVGGGEGAVAGGGERLVGRR